MKRNFPAGTTFFSIKADLVVLEAHGIRFRGAVGIFLRYLGNSSGAVIFAGYDAGQGTIVALNDSFTYHWPS